MDCKNLQREVRKIGKGKLFSPSDNLLREKYHEKLKEYRKTCKSKKYFFLQDNLWEIESVMDDSKSFWEKWKTFGENDSKESGIKIPGGKLYHYFSNLHKETNTDNVEDSEVSNQIPTKEDLNKPFSKNEIKNVVQSLETNKSEGYDCIFFNFFL